MAGRPWVSYWSHFDDWAEAPPEERDSYMQNYPLGEKRHKKPESITNWPACLPAWLWSSLEGSAESKQPIVCCPTPTLHLALDSKTTPPLTGWWNRNWAMNSGFVSLRMEQLLPPIANDRRSTEDRGNISWKTRWKALMKFETKHDWITWKNASIWNCHQFLVCLNWFTPTVRTVCHSLPLVAIHEREAMLLCSVKKVKP